MEAPPATVATHRRGDIQGLRAVAVLLVVAFHAGLDVSGGFIGVDVFFVISGFVITGMLVRERARTGRLSFVDFYSRRARRILPALAITVTVTCGLALLAVSPLKSKASTARTGVSAMFSVANFYLLRHRTGYFGVDQQANPLLHTWSLSVEEQFYLAFPLLLVIAWWVGRRFFPRASRVSVAGVAIAVASAGSFLLCVATTSAGPTALGTVETFAFYMAPARAWEFGAGALVALMVVNPRVLRWVSGRMAVVLGVLGLVTIGYGAFTITSTTSFPGTAALIPVVGTCLLLAAGVASSSGVTGALALRPVQRIGDLSYSWYLWHWPVIVCALALWPGEGTWLGVTAALVSLVPAWLAYRFVENPLRRRTSIVGRRVILLAGVSVAVPAVACLALAKFELPWRSAEARAFLVAAVHPAADGTHNCFRAVSIGKEPPSCTWTVASSKGTVALVGDSEAGQFTEAAARGANRAGYSFVVGTHRGCAFAEVEVRPALNSECIAYIRQSVAAIVRMRPALVLMASSVPYILNPSDVSFQSTAGGPRTTSAPEKARLYAEGVRKAVQPISDAGIPVVVIHTIPQLPSWTPDCAAVRVYLDVRSCGATRPREKVDAARRLSAQAERDGIRGLPLASTFDFGDQICSPTVCRIERNGLWMYRDGYHLSWAGALTLVDDFERLIQAHALPGPSAAAASDAAAAGT